MTHLRSRKNSVIVLTVLCVLVLTVVHNSPAEESFSTLSGRVITAKGEPVAETPIVFLYVRIRENAELDTLYDKTLYPFLRQRPGPPPNMPAHIRQRMMGKMPTEQEKQTRPPFLKTVTDSEGRFTFSEIASGLAQIMVLHANPPEKKPQPPGREHLSYTPPPAIKSIKFGKVAFYPHDFSYSPETGGVTFAIKPGAKIGNVEVIMGTNARNQLLIEGKIIFKDGTPLVDTSLNVKVGNLTLGETDGDTFSRSISTDTDGNFRLSVFAPGIYSLSIEHLGLSSISDMFILKEEGLHEGLVMTLNGNLSELGVAPPENEDIEMNRYRYEPDIPKVWIVNPENGHAYKAVRCESREEAQTKADTEEAHLVTITNEHEQLWLEVAFGNQPFWIGLTYATFGSKWQWDTGEPLEYTNWTLAENDDDFFMRRPPGFPGMDKNFAIMSSEGQWKAIDLQGRSRERARMAVIEKDGMRAKKLDVEE
ncbi:MAG: lectin-like protein [Candidatus Poribacteria bacterium]|nr:lectin-like protein [Candidatus Poribacteria bacterium]